MIVLSAILSGTTGTVMISTFHHSVFADLGALSSLKKSLNQSVSVVIPALNEGATIGKIVSTIKETCVDRFNVVDEIVVIDGSSKDDTVAIAKKCGANTFLSDEIGPSVKCSGKGVALWKSQFVTRGDIVLFVDSDITDFDERFIGGLLGPLLRNPGLVFVKAFYRRPLVIDSNVFIDQGGRVTELLVRPLLKQCVPELAALHQPLSGEYALRKKFLSEISLWSGYSIEIGIVLDAYFKAGLDGIAQVDMDQRFHRNRPLHELSAMASCILRVFMEKMHRQNKLSLSDELHSLIALQENKASGYFTYDSELPPYSQFCAEKISVS